MNRHARARRRPARGRVRAAAFASAAFLAVATAAFLALSAARAEPAAQAPVAAESALATADRLAPYADSVVRGTCRSARARWDAARRLIVTDAEITVAETLRGPARRSLVVTEPGGALPERNLGMVAPDGPRFAPGEELLLFVARDARGETRVVGGAAGRLEMTRDRVTGELRAGRTSLAQLRARIRAAAGRR